MNPADDEPLSNSDPPISASNSAPQKHASSVAVPVNALEIRSAPKTQPDAIETPAAPKALLTEKQCFCFQGSKYRSKSDCEAKRKRKFFREKLRSEAKRKYFSFVRSEAKRTIFQNCEKLREIAKLRKNF